MRFRRLRLLAVSFVLLYGLSIYLFKSSAINSEDILPAGFKEVALDWDFSSLFSKISIDESYSFDVWADRLFERYVSATDNEDSSMAKFRLEPRVPAKYDTIDIPEFVGADSGNPHLLPFDSRLAIGVMLRDMADSLELNPDLSTYQLELFHWADWTDLSVLHQHMFSAGSDRLTCSSFTQPIDKSSRTVRDSLPVADYCVNDSDLGDIIRSVDDESFQAQLRYVQKSTNRLGFHITNHAGRLEHDKRPLFSAAYLNDFMPAPFAIVMLLPSENRNSTMVKIPVDHDLLARTRLVDSLLVQRAAQRSKTLDLREDLTRILGKLPPKPQGKFAITSPLSSDMFLERLVDHLAQLKEKTNLSPLEQNYKEGLEVSLATEWPSKYFNEAKMSSKNFRDWAKGDHYDWHFYKGLVLPDLTQPHLYALLLAWLQFTQSAGIKTWVAHGSLLSWYWNGGFFPWDGDIDVQMPIEELHRLTREYNQTVIVNLGNDPEKEVRTGRYFLDSATWISHRTSGSGHNNIDARFIDLDTGLYVDITGLAVSNSFAPSRYDDQVPKHLSREVATTTVNGAEKHVRIPDDREVERNRETQIYNCRNNHYLTLNELSPLRLSYVQGTPAFIPNKIADILQTEYGSRSIKNQQYSKYAFLPRLGVWHKRTLMRKFSAQKNLGTKLDLGVDDELAQNNLDVFSAMKFSDKDYLEWMSTDPDLLVEYLTGREVSRAHRAEMELLMAGKDTTPAILTENGQLLWKFDDIYHDTSKYKLFMDKTDFNKQVEELLAQWDSYRSGNSILSPAEGDKASGETEENSGRGLEGNSGNDSQDSDLSKNSGMTSGNEVTEERNSGAVKQYGDIDGSPQGEPIINHNEPPKLKAFQMKTPDEKDDQI